MNITGGKYNSLKVIAPHFNTVRPTLSKIRAGVFNCLSSQMDFSNKCFLDCFAGSGIISLEALSRGFKKVITIEKDLKTCKIIEENFKTIKIKPNLIKKDTIKVLSEINDKFDVIYIDPPYLNNSLYETTLDIIQKKNILNIKGIIVVECENNKHNFSIPKELTVYKQKKYGSTLILFLKLEEVSS